MSQLFIVASPIGNLGDITLRAIETLKIVDRIACEDTRHTKKLLNHLGVKKPVFSCRAANEESSAKGIIALLEKGENLAYLCDAGTPSISDPGAKLVALVRKNGYKIVPIPGASALTALLSVSGCMAKTISFYGFLPIKEGRRKKELGVLLEAGAFVLYESPFRVIKLLRQLKELAPQREILLGREMTKIHEEFLNGRAQELMDILEKRDSIKGEFVLLVN